MKRFFILICMMTQFVANAQFTESFSDSNFTQDPVWIGNAGNWVVNTQQKLQSIYTVANSTFYLSTSNIKATDAQWEFSVQMAFNPSGVNYIDVYLTASDSNLSNLNSSGYFIRLGNTDDEISLYRKDTGVSIKIIDGTNGILNNSNNSIKIKIIRNINNEWFLLRDINTTGFVPEGSVIDSNYLTSEYFGIVVKQSTSSFFQKHFFDDIVVADFVPDTIPPLIDSIIVCGQNKLDVLFNEPVEQSSSENIQNYFVDNNIGAPTYVIRDSMNESLVHLIFPNNFPLRSNLLLSINAVRDVSGNELQNENKIFLIYKSNSYDIIIDEIMADPTPSNGMPDAEWIELRNLSPFNINLSGWKIGKSTGISGSMPSFVLKPDSMVLISSSSSAILLTPISKTLGISSFPSLSNTGDLLYLLSPEGNTIHAVEYNDDWYQNELKKQGGWSLEMIDINNPCTGFDNWQASTNIIGATPGKINSIDAMNIDEFPPKLIRAFANDSLHITLYFNEPLDSLTAADINHYNISDGIGKPIVSSPAEPLFSKVNIVLSTPLLRNKIYTITVSGIKDCIANEIGAANYAKIGLCESLDSFDVVVNEILFNPKPDAVDYVEIYNRSNKIINLKKMFIANLNSFNSIDNITPVKNENYSLFPKDYLAITTDVSTVKRNYVSNNPDGISYIDYLPSFNDDEGNVVLLNEQGNTIDKLSYNADWHFKLITNAEGVSLERINYDSKTQDAQNWHSASSSVGYGTPAYKNSQCNKDATLNGEINIEPKIISPDNDGRDDVATIFYSFDEPGYVANISIFDANGRIVKLLKRSALCGIKGTFNWDGLNENNQKIISGIYIIYTEVFDLNGKTKKFKNVVVVKQ